MKVITTLLKTIFIISTFICANIVHGQIFAVLLGMFLGMYMLTVFLIAFMEK